MKVTDASSDNIFDTQARPHATRQHRNVRAAQRNAPGYSELGNSSGNAESQPLSRSNSSIPLPDNGPNADLIYGFSLLPGSSILNHLPALNASKPDANGTGTNGVTPATNGSTWLSTLASLPYRASGRGRRNYASSANMPTWFTNPAAHGLPTHSQQTNIQPGKIDGTGKCYQALKAIPADDVSNDLDSIRKKRRTNGYGYDAPARRSAARKYAAS